MCLPSRYSGPMRPRPLSSRLAPLAGAALLVSLSACSSLKFERSTATSGTYRSSSVAFTLFSIDMPADALQIARENASDVGRAAMIERTARVTNWGWWNWVLDIISIRRAKVTGTWGFEEP